MGLFKRTKTFARRTWKGLLVAAGFEPIPWEPVAALPGAPRLPKAPQPRHQKQGDAQPHDERSEYQELLQEAQTEFLRLVRKKNSRDSQDRQKVSSLLTATQTMLACEDKYERFKHWRDVYILACKNALPALQSLARTQFVETLHKFHLHHVVKEAGPILGLPKDDPLRVFLTERLRPHAMALWSDPICSKILGRYKGEPYLLGLQKKDADRILKRVAPQPSDTFAPSAKLPGWLPPPAPDEIRLEIFATDTIRQSIAAMITTVFLTLFILSFIILSGAGLIIYDKRSGDLGFHTLRGAAFSVLQVLIWWLDGDERREEHTELLQLGP